MFLVPAYGAVRKRLDGVRLLQAVTVFFAVAMLGFSTATYYGISTSFAFFIWVSIFGVMIIAQFWAFAADTFNLKSGQRLFPVIMVGANLGALAGGEFASLAVAALHPVGLMIVATLMLAATVVVARPARAATPEGSRAVSPEHGVAPAKLLGGIELVLRDRYLLLVALFIVLMNWINTTGGYLLGKMVTRDVEARVAASAGALSEDVAVHGLLRQLQFLGHARGTRDPAPARGANLSLGRNPRRAAPAAASRGAGVRPDGVRADLLDHTTGQDRRGQCQQLADEHDAAGVVPARRPRREVRG